MSDQTRDVKLWFIRETEKAILYCKNRVRKDESDLIWIPRSLISHRRKFAAMQNDMPEHVVSMAEWFADKEEL